MNTMKKMTIYQLTVTALMAAVMCILAPMSIPIGPVPISLMTLMIYISVYLLGSKLATVSVLVYFALGIVGLPVFSGGEGGVGKLLGPTGGYIIGYIFLVLISGIFVERFAAKKLIHVIGMIAGTLVLYAFGTVWFMIQTKMDLVAALTACVLPFLIGDGAKIAIAVIAGPIIRSRLAKAELLPNSNKITV